MKLSGSMTEQEYREQLTDSHSSLFTSPQKQRLLACLTSHYPQMRTAYILGWTPEQGEDIYRILINTDTVCAVEIEHDQEEPSAIEAIPIKEYEKELSKTGRIKLAIALELAAKDIAATKEKPM